MKRIQFDKRILSIPTEIGELNPQQIIRLVELQNASLTIIQFNVLNMLNILDVKNTPWLKWYFFKNEYLIPALDKITFGFFTWKVKTINPDDLYLLCTAFPAFQKDDNFPLDNPIPKLKYDIFNYSYYSGPTKLFNNITFRQFRKAEEYFVKYFDKKQVADLDLLVAWLYTNNSNNPTLSLNPNIVNIRAKRISKIAHAKKLTILYFYLANREKIMKLYKYLYPQKRTTTPLKPRNYYQIKTDFEKSLRLLSPDITRDEQTDFQNVHDALAHLNDKCEETHKIEELYKNQR